VQELAMSVNFCQFAGQAPAKPVTPTTQTGSFTHSKFRPRPFAAGYPDF
jgi:hypothetical protein